jgi:hypothetical protein
MGWKSFLKPSLLKVILTVVLFMAPLLLVGWPSPGSEGPRYAGFPIPFTGSGTGEGAEGENTIQWPLLIIDLVFWYLVSCLIAGALKREKK